MSSLQPLIANTTHEESLCASEESCAFLVVYVCVCMHACVRACMRVCVCHFPSVYPPDYTHTPGCQCVCVCV